MSIPNHGNMPKRLMIYNAKGGVGKTAIALILALERGYSIVTNDRLSILDEVLPEGSYIILKEDEPLFKIEPAIPVIYDFGGFLDARAVEALKESQALIVPMSPHEENIQKTLDFIAEMATFQDDIIVIVNKSTDAQFQEIKAIFNHYCPSVALFPLKISKGVSRAIKERKSLSELVKLGGLAGYHFKAISEQLNKIINYLGKNEKQFRQISKRSQPKFTKN